MFIRSSMTRLTMSLVIMAMRREGYWAFRGATNSAQSPRPNPSLEPGTVKGRGAIPPKLWRMHGYPHREEVGHAFRCIACFLVRCRHACRARDRERRAERQDRCPQAN